MQIVDRQLQVFEDWDRKHRRRIAELVTDELVAEHAHDPLGPHSDTLSRVLAYLRRAPIAGKLVIVATRPWEEYRLAELTGVRGQPARLVDDATFTTEEAAMHEVFLRRVRALREEA